MHTYILHSVHSSSHIQRKLTEKLAPYAVPGVPHGNRSINVVPGFDPGEKQLAGNVARDAQPGTLEVLVAGVAAASPSAPLAPGGARDVEVDVARAAAVEPRAASNQANANVYKSCLSHVSWIGPCERSANLRRLPVMNNCTFVLCHLLLGTGMTKNSSYNMQTENEHHHNKTKATSSRQWC
jgi:hypothetical protein